MVLTLGNRGSPPPSIVFSSCEISPLGDKKRKKTGTQTIDKFGKNGPKSSHFEVKNRHI
jgi:hypothetical protein